MTKAVYLVDSGLRLWNSLEKSENIGYRTLTIVTQSKQSMLTLLFSVFAILGQLFLKIYRWHTIGTPFIGNKIQLIRLIKELSEDVPGFQKTYLRESTVPGVWCNTSELKLPFGSTQFDYLPNEQKTVLMFSSNDIENSEKAWSVLSAFANSFDFESIVEFLERNPELVVARMFEEETHIAFQMYGYAEKIIDIKNRLIPIGMVPMDKRDDVIDFINGA